MDEYTRLKQGVKWLWSLGDYGEVATRLEPHAKYLAEACGIKPGMEVLDVAAGNGNFAIAAARLGAHVTASDLAPKMVELGRARTAAEGLAIDWFEADAEDLPFGGESFDVVASVFGAMFGPQPDRVAAELFRVTRPNGRVGMANYGNHGYLPRMADLVTAYALATTNLPSPFLWGDEVEVRRRFNGLASAIDSQPRRLSFAFDSVDGATGFWERTNAPVNALKAMLPPDRYGEFRGRLSDLVGELNQSKDGQIVLESDYLMVVARK